MSRTPVILVVLYSEWKIILKVLGILPQVKVFGIDCGLQGSYTI
jgi:hypothetical protein